MRHSRLHESSYWAGRAGVRITEWVDVWTERDKVDLIARLIIEDATAMVSEHLDEIDLSEFVVPIKNEESFEEWFETWN